jgi:hypothetical protein
MPPTLSARTFFGKVLAKLKTSKTAQDPLELSALEPPKKPPRTECLNLGVAQ